MMSDSVIVKSTNINCAFDERQTRRRFNRNLRGVLTPSMRVRPVRFYARVRYIKCNRTKSTLYKHCTSAQTVHNDIFKYVRNWMPAVNASKNVPRNEIDSLPGCSTFAAHFSTRYSTTSMCPFLQARTSGVAPLVLAETSWATSSLGRWSRKTWNKNYGWV